MSNKVQQLDEWHVILDRDDIDLRSQAKIDYAEEMIAKILPDIDESDLLVECQLNKRVVLVFTHWERAELYEKQFKDCGILVKIQKEKK